MIRLSHRSLRIRSIEGFDYRPAPIPIDPSSDSALQRLSSRGPETRQADSARFFAGPKDLAAAATGHLAEAARQPRRHDRPKASAVPPSPSRADVVRCRVIRAAAAPGHLSIRGQILRPCRHLRMGRLRVTGPQDDSLGRAMGPSAATRGIRDPARSDNDPSGSRSQHSALSHFRAPAGGDRDRRRPVARNAPDQNPKFTPSCSRRPGSAVHHSALPNEALGWPLSKRDSDSYSR